MTRRQLRARNNSSGTGHSMSRSLVIETSAIPTQLDVGLTFTVRGRTSITLSCPLSRLTPLSFLVAVAPRLSPCKRTSAVTIPRQVRFKLILKINVYQYKIQQIVHA